MHHHPRTLFYDIPGVGTQFYGIPESFKCTNFLAVNFSVLLFDVTDWLNMLEWEQKKCVDVQFPKTPE